MKRSRGIDAGETTVADFGKRLRINDDDGFCNSTTPSSLIDRTPDRITHVRHGSPNIHNHLVVSDRDRLEQESRVHLHSEDRQEADINFSAVNAFLSGLHRERLMRSEWRRRQSPPDCRRSPSSAYNMGFSGDFQDSQMMQSPYNDGGPHNGAVHVDLHMQEQYRRDYEARINREETQQCTQQQQQQQHANMYAHRLGSAFTCSFRSNSCWDNQAQHDKESRRSGATPNGHHQVYDHDDSMQIGD
jgi:hypothetical protein